MIEKIVCSFSSGGQEKDVLHLDGRFLFYLFIQTFHSILIVLLEFWLVEKRFFFFFLLPPLLIHPFRCFRQRFIIITFFKKKYSLIVSLCVAFLALWRVVLLPTPLSRWNIDLVHLFRHHYYYCLHFLEWVSLSLSSRSLRVRHSRKDRRLSESYSLVK